MLKILQKIKKKIFRNFRYSDYLKLIGVHVGDGCEIFRNVSFGSEPYLIRIGDNVRITSGVR